MARTLERGFEYKWLVKVNAGNIVKLFTLELLHDIFDVWLVANPVSQPISRLDIPISQNHISSPTQGHGEGKKKILQYRYLPFRLLPIGVGELLRREFLGIPSRTL
jgi:hypothetical protein